METRDRVLRRKFLRQEPKMREELLRDGESSLLEESMYVALAPEVAKLLSQM